MSASVALDPAPGPDIATPSAPPGTVPFPIAPAGTLNASALVQLAHLLLAAAGAPIPPVSTPAPTLTAAPRCPLALEVVHEMIAWKSGRGLDTHYLDQLARMTKRFGTWFSRPIAQLSAEAVREFLEKQEAGARTRNNLLAAIRALANFAMSRRYLPPTFDDLRWVERYREPVDAEVDIYTPEEIRRILACSGKGRAAIAIQAFAGLRTAEVAKLRWEEVDLERGIICVTAKNAKTRQRRLVPICDNLAEWLKPLRKAKGLVYGGGTRSYISNSLQKRFEQAGVTRRLNGLRHSFGSYRLEVVKNEHQVALEMGNSPAMIFKHYRAAVYPDTAKAYWSIVPEGVGTSPKQRKVLAFIAANPGCTGKKITLDFYGLPRAVNGNHATALLIRSGLVASQSNEGQARTYWITDEGRRILGEAA